SVKAVVDALIHKLLGEVAVPASRRERAKAAKRFIKARHALSLFAAACIASKVGLQGFPSKGQDFLGGRADKRVVCITRSKSARAAPRGGETLPAAFCRDTPGSRERVPVAVSRLQCGTRTRP